LEFLEVIRNSCKNNKIAPLPTKFTLQGHILARKLWANNIVPTVFCALTWLAQLSHLVR